MKCWKCGLEEELPSPTPFRATCESCAAYFRSCKGCINYQPGLPNDCRVPGTDPIADREASNFCEEYKPGPGPYAKPSSSDDAKNDFDDLFKF